MKIQRVQIKAILLVVAIMLGGGISYYYYHQKNNHVYAHSIIDFDYNRDAQDIMQLMKDNWYWLIAETKKDAPADLSKFNVEHMLRTKSPNDYNPEYFGKLNIRVMRDKEGFKGFVAYYKKSFYKGQLLFIAVSKQFRERGYGKILAQYVLDEFKRMGVFRVRLITRVDNLPAQAVYKKLGFKQVWTDGTYLDFEVLLDKQN
ncbi:N-acetyltransferase [Candidatus Dependentiae bacterium]|nr:N-acetyltransferase [Candidatus Dependentiae bacterium]